MNTLKIIEGRRCYDCVHYIYDEMDNRNDVCNYNGLHECDPYEAESCRCFKEQDNVNYQRAREEHDYALTEKPFRTRRDYSGDNRMDEHERN